MWLYRGAQSAVFYYATCTPCAHSMYRRKRRKDAVRSRRDKEKADALVTDQPRPFPQPTPFSTNKGWNEEIALGPGPPAKRGGTRNPGRDWNTHSLSDSSLPSNRDPAGGDAEAPKKDKSKNPLGERWNWMRDQREDEPLWGMNTETRNSGSARQRDADPPTRKYYVARVPPVNDLHPPIVSGPTHRAETRWMLQPPPSAKVMAGKERFNTGRGNTGMTGDEDAPGIQGEQSWSSSASNRKSPSPNNNSSSSHSPAINTIRKDTPGTTTSAETNPRLPRPPPTHSTNSRNHITFSRNESHSATLPPGESRSSSLSTVSSSDSEGRSPGISWQFPDMPMSRPVSKPANKPRPGVQRTLSALPDDDTKDIHLLQLEINDDGHDVGVGKMERIRPWRWSMDI